MIFFLVQDLILDHKLHLLVMSLQFLFWDSFRSLSFMNLTLVESKGQLLCRMPLNLVCLMFLYD